MTPFLSSFSFNEVPKKVSYLEGSPFNLSNELSFFHNKNRFRKELTRLQEIFKIYINQTLPASGIRDSYLREEYSVNYLIVILTNNEIIKSADKIIDNLGQLKISPGCFYMESKSNYLLLISKDMKGLIKGVDYFKEILSQVLENYVNHKDFDDFIQIRQFILSNC